MTDNIDRAASLLDDHDIDFDHGSGYDPRNIERAQALADAGLLAPEPQIIRTREELEALDPETLCVTSAFGNIFPAMVLHKRPEHALPAVVIASGAQVRAARTALQEATE